MVCSVGDPAGTMTHTARGAESFWTSSSSDRAGIAPWSAAQSVTAAERSNATTRCPPCRRRVTMFMPILPKPTNPISIAGPFLVKYLGRILAQRRRRRCRSWSSCRHVPPVTNPNRGIPCLDAFVRWMREVIMSPAAILHGLLLVVLLVACTSPPPIIGNPAQEAAKRDLNLLNARVIHAYQEREEARKRVEFFKRQLAQRGLSAKERAGIQVDLEE